MYVLGGTTDAWIDIPQRHVCGKLRRMAVTLSENRTGSPARMCCHILGKLGSIIFESLQCVGIFILVSLEVIGDEFD